MKIKTARLFFVVSTCLIGLFFVSTAFTPLDGSKFQDSLPVQIVNSPIVKGSEDGPYIEISRNGLIEKTIKDGKVVVKNLPAKSMKTKFKPEPSVFKNVSKIVAFSDLHGQYDLSLKLLRKNKVIDKNGNWIYGDGHLVIVGDVFDRGDKVTELLWFIFHLEEQATTQGGKVHFLLGNHEYMIFQDDLRHINKKYKKTAELLETTYPDLFGKNTILGRWLRSKSTVIKINDIIFVHGGISVEFIAEAGGMNLQRTNRQMRKSIDADFNSDEFNPLYGIYHYDTGPIWYRGYFKKDFKKKDASQLLKKLKANHIVVGHTSQKKVKSLFDDKIFAVDSSIKNGEYGEILLIENGNFWRGAPNGDRKKL